MVVEGTKFCLVVNALGRVDSSFKDPRLIITKRGRKRTVPAEPCIT